METRIPPQVPIMKRVVLNELPAVLLVHLKRFEYNFEIDVVRARALRYVTEPARVRASSVAILDFD